MPCSCPYEAQPVDVVTPTGHARPLFEDGDGSVTREEFAAEFGEEGRREWRRVIFIAGDHDYYVGGHRS